jgi:hypothetical protein
MGVWRFAALLSIITISVPAISYSASISSIEAGATLAQVEANHASYDSIFPYYSVQCSFSRARETDGHSTSFMGHTVLYIKGACRDKSVPYPKLKLCDPGTDLTKETSGVALSVEKIVSNSQYVPTDGVDFLLNGSSLPDEPLTIDSVKNTISAVVASGSLNGLKIHDKALRKKPANVSVAEYLAWTGVGTDFAVSFGRDSTCARIPMTQSQIQAEVNYVNETNEPYVTGAEEFSWSAVGDNCAHFTHDVLAAGGIRTEIPRSNNLGRVIYNFVSLHWEIPTNDVLKDLEFANDLTQIRSAEEVFNDHDEREVFNKLGTLPRLGATIEEIPMHLVDNDMYKANSPGTFLFELPVVDNRGRKFDALEKDPVYINIADNLERTLTHLQGVHAQAKAEALSIPQEARPSDLAEFSTRYNAWVDQSIVDIQAKLAKIAQLKISK